ncbi:hypothetical protein SPRG_02140 [Saprolegnia parasitica CBS 223.65]|uniref:Uncharacterized protein n=1 Tax=Saprolegnia parasitica (strain CBS 223.65) TaxID=695850 RepID=A0A067D2S9_SAPPC|nr:hypothetical protein SPRG_02140 [Saprolegnia parasitica CBS 223.65]KDO33332.1 hypothetical protein SPRG_02140 [Saprolegnia parasitica CBS 223.65]|eukprot:XP_012196081.1 hypothetical protein SPRG_02140 [Saprolegnia parasitica CBS 223.65]
MDVSFAVEAGSVEVATIPRKVWRQPPPSARAPAIPDFSQPWRVLRAKKASERGTLRVDTEASAPDASKDLLHWYEPNFAPSAPLFSSEMHEPACFRDATAIDGATAFKVTCNLAFGLGNVEPISCRLTLFDVSLGCRVSEDYCFDANAPPTLNMALGNVRSALFYAMPNQYTQNLYLVLRASKVLQGDGEIATAPYCQPEKFACDAEQSKLIEKAAEASARLGKVHQSLAWGAISVSEGTRHMVLYRQKASMSDDQRLAVLVDASKGTYKCV